MTISETAIGLAAAGLLSVSAYGQWAVSYVEDPSRIDPAAAADLEEKDYAWGDLDHDGDTDLVVVRKQPWTTTGRRTNMLLMNEGGVLVDRTAEYAVASDVAGDQGFLTPTNDRDVVLADVDGDGWLDIVTAVTLTDNEAKPLSHPRVYMNLGETGGVWHGFEYQDARIPQMHPTAGPRFCGISAGDLTGDGRPELSSATTTTARRSRRSSTSTTGCWSTTATGSSRTRRPCGLRIRRCTRRTSASPTTSPT